MFTIAICDDQVSVLSQISSHCEYVMTKEKAEYQCLLFSSGEEVLKYCEKPDTATIDLLILDIELPGINGLQLKEVLLEESKVWRILFLSGHTEGMVEAFGIKTIGFLSKPVDKEKLETKLQGVFKEHESRQWVHLQGTGPLEKSDFLWDEIIYFEAKGNYTSVFFYDFHEKRVKTILLSQMIGDIESKLQNRDILRVHRSYIVNMNYICEINDKVRLSKTDFLIPVGRKWKERAKTEYMEYLIRKARERLQ